jgi:hypothetical protein
MQRAVNAMRGKVSACLAKKRDELGAVHLARGHWESAVVDRPEAARMALDRHVVRGSVNAARSSRINSAKAAGSGALPHNTRWRSRSHKSPFLSGGLGRHGATWSAPFSRGSRGYAGGPRLLAVATDRLPAEVAASPARLGDRPLSVLIVMNPLETQPNSYLSRGHNQEYVLREV